jgi:hypothetical protein
VVTVYQDNSTPGDASNIAAQIFDTRVDAIGDPIVRSAAVLAWMRLHPKADMQATAPLCALLEGSERNACDRRMQSPHLHR